MIGKRSNITLKTGGQPASGATSDYTSIKPTNINDPFGNEGASPENKL